MADKNETALINPQDIPYPALRPMGSDDGEESPLAALLGENGTIEREFMPQTKFPTGGTPYWNFEDGSQPIPEVSGVVVYQHDRRTLFPPGSESGERPICISVDGEKGFPISPEVVERYGITMDCTTCAMAQFGTAVDKKSGELTGGQACTLRKDIYLATEQHYIPLLVSFPSTSWRIVKKFLVGQASVGRWFYEFKSSFTLETGKNKGGDEYAIGKPAFVEMLEGSTLAAAQAAHEIWRRIVSQQNEDEVKKMLAEYAQNAEAAADGEKPFE